VQDRNGSDDIKVFPQPFTSKTRISSDMELYKIEVYSILGTKVLERGGEGELDFTNLPSGYYLIKAMSEKGELVKRVQKN
jgi:hypothetical protein